MAGATETGLWLRSLGAESDSDGCARYRARMISALEGFRERAALLAGEISREHPQFTLHDESHFDALWRLADLIAGPDFDLTPTEAFVFGGAVLVHDLGMATAAYVDGYNGTNSLRADPRWPDKVAFVLRGRLGRAPTVEEIESADPAVTHEATSTLLRELHAERAEWLVKASWEGTNGASYSLLEDSALRDAYGPTIGLVAHSHWWTPDAIGKRFNHTIGAAAGCPTAWTVRPLVVACLLRLADASHLDASRAPRFLQALRRPDGESKQHWDFQARLTQPYRKDDRLIYTGTPFGVEEASAWWLCADTLKLVDHEFRLVDTLLVEHHEDRFAARGIDGAHDLHRLAEHLPPAGWLPLDAKVRVSDVISLVKGLGGEQLYGEAPHVPLRELLQNGADSIRARRAIEERDPNWGEIVVRLGKDDDANEPWLEVEDNGVGMSPDVLGGHLLDFGRSFWSSEAVLKELPGLMSKGFESTGRFGVGFFSVFMWSDRVTVTSRKHDASTEDTHVLEFRHGLSQRPILRKAEVAERMIDPGTRVRVAVGAKTLWQLGLAERLFVPALNHLCAWLAPALDITLEVEAGQWRETVSVANDWKEMRLYNVAMRVRRSPLRTGDPPAGTMSALEHLESHQPNSHGRRHQIFNFNEPAAPPAERSPLGDNGRELHSSEGKIAGRALLDPIDHNGGVLVIGGFSAGYLKGVTGVLFGSPLTASRHRGTPGVSAESLAAWASEQANLLVGKLFPAREYEAAAIVQACGGDTGPLPIARTRDGWLNKEELSSWLKRQDEILLRLDSVTGDRAGSHKRPAKCDVFTRESSHAILDRDRFLESRAHRGSTARDWKLEQGRSLLDLVIDAVDGAWGTHYGEVPDLLLLSSLQDDVTTFAADPIARTVRLNRSGPRQPRRR